MDLGDRQNVVVRGTLTFPSCDDRWARQRLSELFLEADDHFVLDELFLADPGSTPEERQRPLFASAAVTPADRFRAVPRSCLVGRIPDWWHAFAMWLNFISEVLRIGSASPDLGNQTRAIFAVVGMSILPLTAFGYAFGCQPRVLAKNVIASFDFWYLLAHVGAITFLEVSGLEPVLNPLVSWPLHAVWAVSVIFSFTAADAVAFRSRAAKAARYGLGAFLCLLQIFCWAFLHESRLRTLQLGLFDSTLGAVAQSLYLTLAAYYGKYVFAIIVDRNSAVLVQLAAGKVTDREFR
jgi:hypothetical protein